jgi:hypothetical protein
LEGVIVNEIVELCCDGSDSHGGISFLCSGFVPLCCDYSISARPLQLLCKSIHFLKFFQIFFFFLSVNFRGLCVWAFLFDCGYSISARPLQFLKIFNYY